MLNRLGLLTFFRFGILTISDSGMSAARGGRLKGAVRLGGQVGKRSCARCQGFGELRAHSSATPPGVDNGFVVYFYPIFAQFCAVHIGSVGGSRVFDEYPVIGLSDGEVFPGCTLGFQHNIGLGGTPRHEARPLGRGRMRPACSPPATVMDHP